MKNISTKQIDHLAKLSALNFSDEEKQKMKGNLEQILDFVDEMNKCTISNQVYDEAEVTLFDLREDEPKPSLTQKAATQNAPDTENGYFVVSKVVD